jgi:dihydropteroate synthase
MPYAFPVKAPGEPPLVMGILNVTPDSFSDGGMYFSTENALARALQSQEEGAGILDVGAQSTRPGHRPVPPEEELRRLLPVLEALKGKLHIPVSVDTYSPRVARAALARGAAIINDVRGAATREMAQAVLEHGASWVLMHNGGGADAAPRYEPDAVTAVRAGLEKLVGQAVAYGLRTSQLCVDPGIGFGKTQEDNLKLLANTARLRLPGVAYLAGVSRKRVVAHSVGGTIAAHTVLQLGGADILRAHDVKEAVQAVRVTSAIDKQRNLL